MIKYYVGMGGDLLEPTRCDGPFETPDAAKEFMRDFLGPFMAPEFMQMTITEVDHEAMTINLYKEDDRPVTLGRIAQ